MPIKGLTDRGLDFPQVGDIRKGDPKKPNSPGADLQYFRVVFDEKEKGAETAFRKVYGDKPTDVNILLPFDTISQCWEAWNEAYVASRMVARSDGETFLYLVDLKTGAVIVQNGLDTNTGVPVPHRRVIGVAGKNEVLCKPVGRLRVLVPELRRAVYLVVHTHSIYDILAISQQLEAIRALNGGHIVGVPLVLRRRPRMISCPDLDNPGKRVRREKWLISVEADPDWVARRLDAMQVAALPALNAGPALLEGKAVETIVGDEDPDDDWEPGEGAPGDDNGFYEGEVQETEEPATSAEEKTVDVHVRPYEPAYLKEALEKAAASDAAKKTAIYPKDRQKLAGSLGKGLEAQGLTHSARENEDARHAIMFYLTGKEHGKDLDDPVVATMLTVWLKPDQYWMPCAEALDELKALFILVTSQELPAATQLDLV